MAIDDHADDMSSTGLLNNSPLRIPPVTMTASYHLCLHNYSIECAACPEYDECPYPDRTSSLMSIVLPAGMTVLSIVAVLAFFLVVR